MLPVMTRTCVGVAVRNLKKDISPKFVTKVSDTKIMIGVPFQGICPVQVIFDYLVENEYIEKDDFITNMVFLGEVQ